MAKKWTPSQKQLSAFDELLRKQNETRRRLLKRRKEVEEEGVGHPLPDLVIPMRARRSRNLNYSFDSYRAYREAMRKLKGLYGNLELSFYKETYKKNILGIVKGWIETLLNYSKAPEGYFGKYSEEQIEEVNMIGEDAGRYLDLYNKLQSLRTEEFMPMYDKGFIPSLHLIYDEMNGDAKSFSKVDEFLDMFGQYRREVRQATEGDPNVMFDPTKRNKRAKARFEKFTK